MVKKIIDVLLKLGKGCSFVGNQYKISMSDKDYYIDLLFYHLELLENYYYIFNINIKGGKGWQKI